MTFLLNAFRGFLIGVAEVIPGVSGGTVALVVGVYERVLDQAAVISRSFAGMTKTRGKSLASLGRLDFGFLLPLLVGMVSAILLAAAILEPLLIREPEITLALFAGLIAVSVVVPLRMVSAWSAKLFAVGGAGAVAAFWLTSLPRGSQANPESWFVFLAAAIAVCALVLPGVSGSFFLLAIGLYQPTIAAVNELDFAYLGFFALGALVGFFSFALLMQFLLSKYRNLTLALMAGLMLGSLRALWPWQSSSAEILSPSDPLGPALACLAGGVTVAALIVWHGRLDRRARQ